MLSHLLQTHETDSLQTGQSRVEASKPPQDLQDIPFIIHSMRAGRFESCCLGVMQYNQ